MPYVANMKYFPEGETEFLKKILPVVIETIGQFCRYYSVGVWTQKKIRPKFTRGAFPDDQKEKREMLHAVSEYITDNLESELFTLFMDSEKLSGWGRRKQGRKFDHHDDTDCWVLFLTEEEFRTLRSAFHLHGSPEDIFITN